MDALTMVAIALGLAMDAFAVAIATSVILGAVSRRQIFRLSFHFGLFQGLMPIVGWLAGLSVERWIRSWDHWLAFGLLTLIGGRAIFDHNDDGEGRSANDPTRGMSLVILSVATSIDALAVGLSFSALRIKVWVPVLVIALTAGVMTVIGMLLGPRLGERFGRRTEVAGGLVLIAIGVKILVEHVLAE